MHAGIPAVLRGVSKLGEYTVSNNSNPEYITITSQGYLVITNLEMGTVPVFSQAMAYLYDLWFPVGSVGILRGIARRGHMLLVVDSSNNCVHVVSEDGPYSHRFDLPANRPLDISVTGSTAFVIHSRVPGPKKVYKIELTEDNQKIAHELILPKSWFGPKKPQKISAQGNHIGITHYSRRLALYDVCSKQVVNVEYLEGIPVNPSDVLIDSKGRVLFTDKTHRRISMVDVEGNFMQHLVTSADGLNCSPTSFTAHKGKLFVVCTGVDPKVLVYEIY
jgi:hypothetical protein